MKVPVVERTVCAYPFFPPYLWAGLTATSLMLSVSALAQGAGLSFVDYPSLLAGVVTGRIAEPLSSSWWAGTAAFFVGGTVLVPLCYVYGAYFQLPGAPAVKGLAWGLVLWLVTELVAAPLLGRGVFFLRSGDPMAQGLVSLLSHLVYGLALGASARGATPEVLALGTADEVIDEVLGFRDRAA